jgi:hypothetical protein
MAIGKANSAVKDVQLNGEMITETAIPSKSISKAGKSTQQKKTAQAGNNVQTGDSVLIEKKTAKKAEKKVVTDIDVKRKAVKLVVAHLRKKLPETEFIGMGHITSWIEEIDKLLEKPEFNMIEYIQMRRNLNDVIERTIDEEMRFKLRDSWYSLGKALDKKVKQK